MANIATGAEPLARRFKVEEYHRMAETGILSSDEIASARSLVRGPSPRDGPRS